MTRKNQEKRHRGSEEELISTRIQHFKNQLEYLKEPGDSVRLLITQSSKKKTAVRTYEKKKKTADDNNNNTS